MEAKRARRRRDLARMKAKAVRIFGRYGFDYDHCIQRANHMQSCSCAGCGNRRNSLYGKGDEKLTMQERRFYAEPIDE